MDYIQNCLYLSLFYYSIIISYFNFSLVNIKYKKKPHIDIFVSVIIAVKNGEKSLPILLQSLIEQTYKKNIEFIIVDDESNDNSLKIINNYINKDHRILTTSSKNGSNLLSHKKKALDAGIKIANGEILLFSDVDCILPKDWVLNTLNCFSKDIDYIVGYSEVPKSSNLVNLFQKIDFFMLMNATHASINKNLYWACSGQNQAYKKSVYIKNNGFNKLSKYLQGDDTLFLQLCNKNLKKFKANFSFNNLNKVYCRSETNIKSFLLQRIRWAGDSINSFMFSKSLFLMSFFTFTANFILLLNLFLYIFQFISVYELIIPFFIKFFVDYSFALKGMKVHNDQYTILEFLFWFLLQPIYILIIGIGSFFQNHIVWKGIKQK